MIDLSEEKKGEEEMIKQCDLETLRRARESGENEEDILVKLAKESLEEIKAVEEAGGVKLFRILLENNFSFSVVRYSGSPGGPKGLFDLALFLDGPSGEEMETEGWLTVENITKIVEFFVPLPQYEEWNKGKLKKLFKVLVKQRQRVKAEKLVEHWTHWGNYKQA